MKETRRLVVEMVEIILRLGNTHEEVANPKKSRDGIHDNNHKWNCFVKVSPDSKYKPKLHKFVEQAKFTLHESFKQPIQIKKPKPDS